ncbi:fungal specific transcription factor domain-containing protein [Aspergillus novofumigatus IBT 16806]|uniref:Uncharacterized protein n=1 Tax=Aspergillus novofumigatus (strain IBT 16806) TaxID=1392255 RepID=A0A2I1C149_ASPN1|nr:uncharacterized protein P174DRAFT_454113 [Aspergillus novofumigatus IBT 16806]PKX91313.1 hypothetical protein P174DRAFT_454113 [Aspergillus novofumigatus IBT 16806]
MPSASVFLAKAVLNRLPANRLRIRILNARRLNSQSSTEPQTRDKGVDGFLADDGPVAVLVHEYLSKIHGRPHSIFHAATLWKDIRDWQASRALILAICAMGAHVSNEPSLRSLAPLLMAESKRLLQINPEHVCLDNIQTCILVAIYAWRMQTLRQNSYSSVSFS